MRHLSSENEIEIIKEYPLSLGQVKEEETLSNNPDVINTDERTGFSNNAGPQTLRDVNLKSQSDTKKSRLSKYRNEEMRMDDEEQNQYSVVGSSNDDDRIKLL